MRRVLAGVLLGVVCLPRRRALAGALVRAGLSPRGRPAELAYARAIVASDRAEVVYRVAQVRVLWLWLVERSTRATEGRMHERR
jgi:hypothetical protein